MTYNEVKKKIENLLASHAMIRETRFCTATEWIKRNSNPELPVCCYSIFSGAFESGYKNFNVKFLFLDKTGKDGEFEMDVVSDQIEIANDIVALMRESHVTGFEVEDSVSFDVLLAEFEDILSGCQMDVNIKTLNTLDTCIIP